MPKQTLRQTNEHVMKPTDKQWTDRQTKDKGHPKASHFPKWVVLIGKWVMGSSNWKMGSSNWKMGSSNWKMGSSNRKMGSSNRKMGSSN